VLDTKEEFVIKAFEYEWQGDVLKGEVKIAQTRKLDSDYVHGEVAKEIAATLKAQGQYVYRDGKAVIGGAAGVDKSSGIEIGVFVDGYFTLQAYTPGAQVSLVVDH
jgi:hypothetical protein